MEETRKPTTWGDEYEKGGYAGLLKACEDSFPFYVAMDDNFVEIAEYLAGEAVGDCHAQGLLETEAQDAMYERLLKDIDKWATVEMDAILKDAGEIHSSLEAAEMPLALVGGAGI